MLTVDVGAIVPSAQTGLPAEKTGVYGLPSTSRGFTTEKFRRPDARQSVMPGGEFDGFAVEPPIRYTTSVMQISAVAQLIATTNARRAYLLIQNMGPDQVYLGADVQPSPDQNAILINPLFEREIKRANCDISLISGPAGALVRVMEGVYDTGAGGGGY